VLGVLGTFGTITRSSDRIFPHLISCFFRLLEFENAAMQCVHVYLRTKRWREMDGGVAGVGGWPGARGSTIVKDSQSMSDWTNQPTHHTTPSAQRVCRRVLCVCAEKFHNIVAACTVISPHSPGERRLR
jgi:hypothetical protein